MATQYRFKTIMVTDENRSEFSTLRDSFGVKVSDKELFEAIFKNFDAAKVKSDILQQKKESAISKEKEKIKKLETKLKEKLNKLQSNQTEEKEAKVA
jgi:pyruvate dehydrogenase complex dehydrogenase (E1) component